MRYSDRNFQRAQERQRQNPKESKRDFLIRTGREKRQLRFYKETAHRIYDAESWHCLTEKQRDEIIRSYNIVDYHLIPNLYSLGWNAYTINGLYFFSSEESWSEYVRQEFRPDPALLRNRALKKIGI